MTPYFDTIKNKSGSAMVIALIALAVLTIIGVTASNVSIIEMQIVRNEQIHQVNFYLAESVAQECAQRIEQETNPEQLFPASTQYGWLSAPDTVIDLSNPENWLDSGDHCAQSLISPDASYAAVAHGVRKGNSLDVSSTRLYEFSVFGKSETNMGRSIIEIGYLKRF